MITWARKVVGKNQHLDIIQAKIEIMQHHVKMFIGIFTPFFKLGLPSLWEENGNIPS